MFPTGSTSLRANVSCRTAFGGLSLSTKDLASPVVVPVLVASVVPPARMLSLKDTALPITSSRAVKDVRTVYVCLRAGETVKRETVADGATSSKAPRNWQVRTMGGPKDTRQSPRPRRLL